jgi:hypothetical protein
MSRHVQPPVKQVVVVTVENGQLSVAQQGVASSQDVKAMLLGAFESVVGGEVSSAMQKTQQSKEAAHEIPARRERVEADPGAVIVDFRSAARVQ